MQTPADDLVTNISRTPCNLRSTWGRRDVGPYRRAHGTPARIYAGTSCPATATAARAAATHPSDTRTTTLHPLTDLPTASRTESGVPTSTALGHQRPPSAAASSIAAIVSTAVSGRHALHSSSSAKAATAAQPRPRLPTSTLCLPNSDGRNTPVTRVSSASAAAAVLAAAMAAAAAAPQHSQYAPPMAYHGEQRATSVYSDPFWQPRQG
ncbi:hypothetical protein BDK51DRAFT_46147 [Blyttiomyces helicus]|uniref:Uncharacterized protein n=1 Tax=Blyttiomyces helicus TaxID=388810 RepID=A0A4P9W2L6_9FUNG|nr:hypothetical protein BDK51DRAFT_46147 [Blyttiomyces helicus]|eukprot:RKO84316.1 hypothetical protein BDK51DRAFT_46147 [Blyttiomyces helicus]